MACHTHRLLRIFPEDNLVKEVCEDIERPLQPLRLGQRYDSIVHVKIRRKVLYQCAKSLRACLRRYYHLHPVM